MAWLIIRVSSVPDAPTSVPATMSSVLLRVKPDAATARPVKALSREMSTGVSAPPMGRTKIAPSTSDRTNTMTSTVVLAVTTVTTSSDDDREPDGGVDGLLARVGDRPSRHELLELGEGDGAARQGDRAHQHAEEDLADLVDGQ